MPISHHHMRVNPALIPRSSVALASAKASLAQKGSSKRNPNNSHQKEDPLQSFQNKIQHFARISNKEALTRTLRECKFLKNICLENSLAALSGTQDYDELEKEVMSQTRLIELNGLDMNDYVVHRKEFIIILQDLIGKLTQGVDILPEEVYKTLILRLAPTTAHTVSSFSINALLGSPDLVLQVPKPKFCHETPQSTLDLYATGDGGLHAVLETHHTFGLYRKSDVITGKPWIRLTCHQRERANLVTGKSVLSATVEII